VLIGGIVLFLCGGQLGCRSGGGSSEPEAKVRLTKLLRLYQVYVQRNGKGPPNEPALREFGQQLSPQERDEYLIGDDLDNIFISPRDKKKFVIRYHVKLDPSQASRAIAWEALGRQGLRYVALSIGYVEEYDEATFQQYNK
jgi:hypothetical protein